jgi:hypothetical protein
MIKRVTNTTSRDSLQNHTKNNDNYSRSNSKNSSKLINFNVSPEKVKKIASNKNVRLYNNLAANRTL